jgi:hypothetical protein
MIIYDQNPQRSMEWRQRQVHSWKVCAYIMHVLRREARTLVLHTYRMYCAFIIYHTWYMYVIPHSERCEAAYMEMRPLECSVR